MSSSIANKPPEGFEAFLTTYQAQREKVLKAGLAMGMPEIEALWHFSWIHYSEAIKEGRKSGSAPEEADRITRQKLTHLMQKEPNYLQSLKFVSKYVLPLPQMHAHCESVEKELKDKLIVVVIPSTVDVAAATAASSAAGVDQKVSNPSCAYSKCGKMLESAHKCSTCQTAMYCNLACRTLHWRAHKPHCSK